MKPVRVVHLILLGAVVCVVLAMMAGIPEQIGRAYAWVSRAEAAEDLPIKKDAPEAKRMSERGEPGSEPGGKPPAADRTGGLPPPPRSAPGGKVAADAEPSARSPVGAKLAPPPVADPYPPKKEIARDFYAKPGRPVKVPAKAFPAKPEEEFFGLPAGLKSVDPMQKTEPDPRLAASQARIEQQRILGRYARSSDERERSGLQAALVKVLDQQFDLQQQERWAEIAAIEARVRRLRETLEKRNRARQTIVEERLSQLLREADGLGWIAPGEPGPVRGMSSPFQEDVREEEVVMPDGSLRRQLIPEYRPAPQPPPAPTATPFDYGKPTPAAAPTLPPPTEPSMPPPLPPEKGMLKGEKSLPPPSSTR